MPQVAWPTCTLHVVNLEGSRRLVVATEPLPLLSDLSELDGSYESKGPDGDAVVNVGHRTLRAMAEHIPDGYHTITPYFTVVDADRLIAFVTAAFGGVVVKDDRDENGQVEHARLQIGDSIIMLNQAGPEYQANVSQMHLYVEDVETVYSKALEAGAVVAMGPNVRPHGDRMAGVADPCGNLWWIASSS